MVSSTWLSTHWPLCKKTFWFWIQIITKLSVSSLKDHFFLGQSCSLKLNLFTKISRINTEQGQINEKTFWLSRFLFNFELKKKKTWNWFSFFLFLLITPTLFLRFEYYKIMMNLKKNKKTYCVKMISKIKAQSSQGKKRWKWTLRWEMRTQTYFQYT